MHLKNKTISGHVIFNETQCVGLKGSNILAHRRILPKDLL